MSGRLWYAVLTALALQVAPMLSHAQDVTVLHSADCAQWFTKQHRYGTQGWLLGYLTGMRDGRLPFVKEKVDPLTIFNSNEQAWAWMDNYCRANPLSTVRDGAIEMFIDLLSRASKR
jgi:hypothetical protein